MDVFTAAPHHEVLALVLQVSVLLLAARLLGELAQRLGQPAVVGELLAGIVLGPSILAGTFHELQGWIVPDTPLQGHLLEVVSLIGAMFLLLVTGFETDLPLIRRHARVAAGVAAGGLVVPFASGLALGFLLPDDLLAAPDGRLLFALFVATAMSISAIPVISKVLMDLQLLRRDIGQTIIAAGMIDDTTGWTLLSIIAGLAAGEAITVLGVAKAVGVVVGFMVVSFTILSGLVSRIVAWVQDWGTDPDRLLTLVVVLAFGWGAVSHALHLEPVLGAFVMGILLGRLPRIPESLRHSIQSLTLAVFAPIFFAVAGLKVNLRALFDWKVALIALVVIATATFGKVAGAYVGARWIGKRDHWTALSFGAGLNARGAMEIIVATIGLSLGILSQDMFSIIVVMAMATSLMAPAALRWALAHVEPEEQELRRLKEEELAASSLVSRIHRVLLPVRPRGREASPIPLVAARLLERMSARTSISVTLLAVCPPGKRAEATAHLDAVTGLFQGGEITRKVVESESPADAILDEARKGYDLVVLGATEQGPKSDTLFTRLIDTVVRVAPCTTMVVQARVVREGWTLTKILVPTNGAAAAKRAAEIGFAIAREPDDEVTILNVVRRDRSAAHYDARGVLLERQFGVSHQIVEELRQTGETLGVRTHGEVRVGPDPGTVILDLAGKDEFDLIILGTDVRPGSERLYLGPAVERILNQSDCPVVVINAA